MQVFKLCLRIFYKNKLLMLIYVIVFLTISIIMSYSITNELQTGTSFSPAKTTVAFINEESTPLIDGFKEELARVADFADIPDEPEALQDALYFRQVSCILRIPKGFTDKFMNGENVQIEKISIPNSIKNVHVELCIDKYFNTARFYVQGTGSISQHELVQHIKNDLAENAYVEIKTREKSANTNLLNFFYNYLAYSLSSVIILGMSTLMLVFNNPDLKMRNSCSPLSSTSANLQFILAVLLFTFTSWLIMVTLCFTINYKDSFSVNTVFFMLSSLVFAFCCSGIGFLVGNLVKSQDAIVAVANVASLGMSFISGVFVPQELLGNQVLKIASFTPAYWYVKANNSIARLTQFTFDTLKPVLGDLIIIFGFGAAFFSVSLAIRKMKES